MSSNKAEINRSMQEIASRRVGRNKLVYDKELRRIVVVDNFGNKTATNLAGPEEANCI